MREVSKDDGEGAKKAILDALMAGIKRNQEAVEEDQKAGKSQKIGGLKKNRYRKGYFR